MAPMHMYVYFDTSCAFVFSGWNTTINDTGMFALGCILCAVYCFLHMGIPFIKDILLVKRASRVGSDENVCPFIVRIFLGIYYFAYTLSNFFIMMIMMTFNGYVLIAVSIGLTIGYWVFSSNKALKDQLDMHEMCHS